MNYQNDTALITILYNIYEHLKKDYDYTLIITGETGTGKSRLALIIMELWYRCILQKPFNESYVANISTDMVKWVSRFRDLKKYDMNIFDEGATALDSRDWMDKFSKAITKMFNVFRKKNFFSIIVLPSYFDLNKYFRERRLRGLIWINRRGEYKFYSKLGISWLNANNEGKAYKSMDVAYSFHNSFFPDYKGCLLKAYQKESDVAVDKILDETLVTLHTQKEKRLSLTQLVRDDVLRLRKDGKTFREISKELGVSPATVSKVIYMSKL